MFDIFRKPTSHSGEPAPAAAAEEQSQSAQSDYAERKRIALAEAAALPKDEDAAVSFILTSEFADARLQAAQSVHSRPAVEQVLQAMRNSDRRVAKLMQSRLDAFQAQECAGRLADQCLASAQALLGEPSVSPNQVGDLDRQWQNVQDAPLSAKEAFETVRESLRMRLEAQAALQRAVLDALAELRGLLASDLSAAIEETAQRLNELESKMVSYRAAPEAPSLPKGLAAEFAQAASALNESLRQARQRRDALAVKQERPAEAGDADRNKAEQAKQSAKALSAQTEQLLGKMEAALEEGSLQLASEHDKALHTLDPKAGALPHRLSARLAKARAELKRLQGWARWGGHVSREELLHAAEALAAQSVPAPELAKKVGSLRERWKSLDASAGPSGKELWQRFDQACTAAYAPAAKQFKQQAEERKRNAEKAQALIEELKRRAQQSTGDSAQTDWKALAACVDRSKQAWQRLGSMDRKEKKRLDAEFDAVMQTFAVPLASQRAEEIARRERLIADAERLDPKDRALPDTLRALQEKWQQQAKTLPLERKDEQALWQKFRAACNRAYDARKEVAKVMDAERHAHLQEKEGLCVQIEAMQETTEAAIRSLLRETAQAWERIGPVPRAIEAKLEARYRKAVEQLRKRLDETKRKALGLQYDALIARLKLCWALEANITSRSADASSAPDDLAAAWQAAPETFKELTSDLQERFRAGVAALQAGDAGFASRLEQNRSSLLRELLRLEIVCGMQSPAELSQERLRLQVEVLQSALKTGQASRTGHKGAEIFKDLVRLPAAADEQAAARIVRLIAHCKT
jgi:hypothetical protein